jgi:hypothetical protein
MRLLSGFFSNAKKHVEDEVVVVVVIVTAAAAANDTNDRGKAAQEHFQTLLYNAPSSNYAGILAPRCEGRCFFGI